MGDKPDCTLSDGTLVTIDLTKISIKEWRDIWSPFTADEAGDASVAKITGLTVERVSAMPLLDYKRITLAASRKFREPLADPT